MEAYQYFGLSSPPFETAPKPQYFYATPAYAEALATLEYALHAGKACTLVLGDSGSGKTLLGQILARKINARTGVLWVHGIGQPPGETEVTVYPTGSFGTRGTQDKQEIRRVRLSDWIRDELPMSRATAAIVDDADGLPPHAWEDIVSLVTREIRTPRPIGVVLLGLPTLLEPLTSEGLLRLRRRVFRTCHLTPLTSADVAGYIRHRVKVAGGDASRIFSPATYEVLQRFSMGNPALINQLCDNALIDAFADDRKRIEGRHIVGTVHAITGGMPEQLTPPRRKLELPTPVEKRHALPAVTGPSGTPVGVPAKGQKTGSGLFTRPVEPAAQNAAGLTRMAEPERVPDGVDKEQVDAVDDGDPAPMSLTDGLLEEAEREADAVTAGSEVTAVLDNRLRELELRLSTALNRVREARYAPTKSARMPLTDAGETSFHPADELIEATDDDDVADQLADSPIEE